jgi:nitroimidazol reductase NimA-like FMN-containing flavoprotein (pyridoxamine 5'-phosphate oxidase superfamily)
MRKKDKEVTDVSAINAIIKKATVCRLGMIFGDRPYIVPLCFGYQDNALYFHGSLKGLKIDLIKENQNVCFELDIAPKPISAEEACKWDMQYQSVIGFGKAVLIEDSAEKRKALGIIMAQYADQHFQFPDNKVKTTAVIKVQIESMTGKQCGF